MHQGVRDIVIASGGVFIGVCATILAISLLRDDKVNSAALPSDASGLVPVAKQVDPGKPPLPGARSPQTDGASEAQFIPAGQVVPEGHVAVALSSLQHLEISPLTFDRSALSETVLEIFALRDSDWAELQAAWKSALERLQRAELDSLTVVETGDDYVKCVIEPFYDTTGEAILRDFELRVKDILGDEIGTAFYSTVAQGWLDDRNLDFGKFRRILQVDVDRLSPAPYTLEVSYELNGRPYGGSYRSNFVEYPPRYEHIFTTE